MITKGWQVQYRDPKTEERMTSRTYHAKSAADTLKRIAEANGMVEVNILTVQGHDTLETSSD